MTIEIDRKGQSMTMDFWSGYEKDGGYTPDVFVGTVDEAGQIAASPPANTVTYSTWTLGPGCYSGGWTIESGELSGTLSLDGHAISGSIVESFRAIPQGQIFTIRSHFTAASPR